MWPTKSANAEAVRRPRSRRRSRRRHSPTRTASAASGRRAYSVSGTPWSARRSASPLPIWPSPTMPTRLLLKWDLAAKDPRDQVDQLAERLDRVPAREPGELSRVDRHVVLPLQLLEEGEKEERIEVEVVEEVCLVAHLGDVALELVGQEALHLHAHLRTVGVGPRAGGAHGAALVRHGSSCRVLKASVARSV